MQFLYIFKLFLHVLIVKFAHTYTSWIVSWSSDIIELRTKMKYSIKILPGGLCSIDQKAFQTILNSNYNYMLCNAARIAMDLSIARDNATITTLFGNAKKLK